MVGIGIPVPQKRNRPTLREVAQLIVVGRQIEKMHIHSAADNCAPHAMLAQMAAPALIRMLPRRLRNDHDLHRLITAPAAREYAREELDA